MARKETKPADRARQEMEKERQAMEAVAVLSDMERQEQQLEQEEDNKSHDEQFSNFGANGTGEQIVTDPEGNVAAVAAVPVIGKEEIFKATEILQRYKKDKANLDNRVVENEQWWKLRHWSVIEEKGKESADRIKPVSAWLFNSLANKHADAMDNYPEPNVLGREQSDEQAAKMLSDILPIILEQNNFEKTYSDTWWYKLKQGGGVYSCMWDNSKQNGLGDISVKKIDVLNLFWKSGISDIQDSPHLFYVSLVDNEQLHEEYPDLDLTNTSSTLAVKEYIYDDTVDTSEMSAVVDWYYKKNIYEQNELGLPVVRTSLQYCRYVNDTVLYASENDPNYANRGWYDHGKYPFIIDTLFAQEGTPFGFGFIDVMKDSQLYIDKLQQSILENAIAGSRPRWMVREDGGINEKDFADLSKAIIKVQGPVDQDHVRQWQHIPMSGIYESVLKDKITELKETSGNTDVSRGETSSGVTAASAISALQEASGKLSRDMIKQSYRAYQELCYMVLELIRQFYDMPRTYRLTGSGGQNAYVDFDNRMMQPQPTDVGERLPVFDIEVVAQKKSAYTKMAQNELAIQFYQLGFFAPQNADTSISCLSMMDFDDKDKVTEMVRRNGILYERVEQMQQLVAQLAAALDQATGGNTGAQVVAAISGQQMAPAAPEETGGQIEERKGSQAERSAKMAANAASPR